MRHDNQAQLALVNVNRAIAKWRRVRKWSGVPFFTAGIGALFAILAGQPRPNFTSSPSEIHWGLTAAFAVLIVSIILFLGIYLTSTFKLKSPRKQRRLS